jgi:hypothetical protein
VLALDSNEYSEPTPKDRDPSGTKSICSDFEKDDPAGDAVCYMKQHIP